VKDIAEFVLLGKEFPHQIGVVPEFVERMVTEVRTYDIRIGIVRYAYRGFAAGN
jgi:hypothetical protein